MDRYASFGGKEMNENTPLKQLRDNWVVLSFIVMLIVSWTTFNSRLTSAEEDIKDLKLISQQITQMQVDIAVIKNQVLTINGKLP